MTFKKVLKIGGLVLLALVILFIGFTIVVNSFNKITEKSGYNQATMGIVNLPQGDIGIVSSKPGRDYSYDMAANPDIVSRETVASQTASVDKKIIKTGSLSLKVEKAETAAEAITNIAKLNKGEVSNSNFSESSRGIKSGYITIRVPNQNFETVFDEIKKIATQVLNESTNAQDITEEYIDLQARLNNKKAEEQSFVALLNRSGKIEEVLAVTREIARTRGEIEQLEGQMRYLNSQTDMSTITVSLSEDVEITPVSQDWRPWQVFKTSVKQLITNSQNFISGLIRFIIVVIPMLFIYFIILWLVYYIGKKIYRHFRKPNQ